MTTPAEMVDQYLKMRDWIDAEDSAYAAKIKPYKDAMALIEQIMLEHLNANGAQNLKCEAGTAYKKPYLSAKVDNRDRFLEFIKENNRWEFLDARVLKEPVREYLDIHQAAPPGVATETGIKVHIRRS